MRTVLQSTDIPEEKYLIATELFQAGGIPMKPDSQTALSRILSRADELSSKLGTEPMEVEPIRAYYREDNGEVKDCLVLGRGEVDALLMALLDKAFIRVAMFQNQIWPQSLWNVVVGEN